MSAFLSLRHVRGSPLPLRVHPHLKNCRPPGCYRPLLRPRRQRFPWFFPRSTSLNDGRTILHASVSFLNKKSFSFSRDSCLANLLTSSATSLQAVIDRPDALILSILRRSIHVWHTCPRAPEYCTPCVSQTKEAASARGCSSMCARFYARYFLAFIRAL